MNFNKSKFNKKVEEIYLNNFSGHRYRFFQFLEKLYKKTINNKDGRIQFILNSIIENKPNNILEIGSGVVPIYFYLPVDIQKKCNYHICEINKKKVDYLLKKHPHLNVKCADAFSLPYESSYFDFIFSKGVFHHIDDDNESKRIKKKSDFLIESKRVLKKDGVNLLMDFCYTPKRFRDFFWHKLYEIILWEGDYNYLNRIEVEKLFNITGYKNIKSSEFETFKGLYYFVTGKKQ